MEKAVLIISAMALLTTLGDYFLKLASADRDLRLKPLILGVLIYGATAIGWALALREVRLSVLSVLFGVMTILFGVALGVFVFGESLSRTEMLGVALALGAILLLARFS